MFGVSVCRANTLLMAERELLCEQLQGQLGEIATAALHAHFRHRVIIHNLCIHACAS